MITDELMMPESEPADIVHIDTSGYAGRPIDRDLVVDFADTLMGIHPNASDIGVRGMRTVAQLALLTGANPLPGTNGIHAWESKGKLCIQFGMGYWRGKADGEGGVLWVARPRVMSEDERQNYGIAENQTASICIGALNREVFGLLQQARSLEIDMSFKDAKNEVARVGIGTVNPGEYDKAGRPKQWTADLRSERDLLRQLVPVLVPDASAGGKIKTSGTDWNLASYTRQHLDAPELPDGYGIEDANSDFFEDEPGIIDGELAEESSSVIENNGQPAPNKQVTIPMLKDLHILGERKHGKEWKAKCEAIHAELGTTSTKEWSWEQYWMVHKELEALEVTT